jgi:protoporphyrinogen/coproporphyrinogen III oxidase
MLGSIANTDSRDVAVVGGGFAGLTLALTLARKNYAVTLYEASERCGGMLQTEIIAQARSESAANSLLVSPAVEELCASLGVGLERLATTARARYIYRSGALRKFPLNVAETAASAYRLLFHRAREPHQENTAKSVGEWAQEFLGECACNYLIAPAVLGIYGCSPDRLEMISVRPSLQVPQGKSLGRHMWDLSRQKEVKAKSYSATPVGGMETLTSAIEKELEGSGNVTILKKTPLTSLSDLNSYKNICLCVPAYVAATLLAKECSITSKLLADINYVNLVSVTFIGKRSDFTKVPEGTGVLFPPHEKKYALGILFCSSSFPSVAGKDDQVVLRVFLGGTINQDVFYQEDDEIKSKLITLFNEIWGFRVEAHQLWRVYRWEHALPLYAPGYKARLAAMPWVAQKGRVLFGNYTGKISLRGMVESLNLCFG